MSSERRIRASRANGKLSRGTITEEGKRRGAGNRMRYSYRRHSTFRAIESRFQGVLQRYETRCDIRT